LLFLYINFLTYYGRTAKKNPCLLEDAVNEFCGKGLRIDPFTVNNGYPYPLIPPYNARFFLPCIFAEDKKIEISTYESDKSTNWQWPIEFEEDNGNPAAYVRFQGAFPASPILKAKIDKSNRLKTGIVLAQRTDREIFFPDYVFINGEPVRTLQVSIYPYGDEKTIAYQWSEMINGETPFRPAIVIITPIRPNIPQTTALCLAPNALYEHYQQLIKANQ